MTLGFTAATNRGVVPCAAMVRRNEDVGMKQFGMFEQFRLAGS